MSEWGDGYSAGTTGLVKAVETAKLIGATEERQRIIALIVAIKDNWRKPASFNYQNELFQLIQLIQDTKDNK